jgi:hypothetical protein
MNQKESYLRTALQDALGADFSFAIQAASKQIAPSIYLGFGRFDSIFMSDMVRKHKMNPDYPFSPKQKETTCKIMKKYWKKAASNFPEKCEEILNNFHRKTILENI